MFDRLSPDRYEVTARAVRYAAWIELVVAPGVAWVQQSERFGIWLVAVIFPTWALLLVASTALELGVELLDELRDRRDLSGDP